MRFRGFVARLQCWVHSTWHSKTGSYCLRRGNLSRAKEHFLELIRIDPDSFSGHLGLGRTYLRQECLSLAFEELQRARELSPDRFAEEQLPGDPLFWLLERHPEARRQQSVAAAKSGLETEELPASDAVFHDRGTADGGVYDNSGDPDPLPFGDFSGRAEAERFSLLPPLSLFDTDNVDWDQLGRDLTEQDR